MPVYRSQEDAYDRCVAEGYIKTVGDCDAEQIEATLKIAREDLASAKDDIIKKRWNSGYKSHYDVLHELVGAYLLFENVKSSNHVCLFAYLCVKHPELELNWEFFERIRTKRNGINYYGTLVSENDWREAAIAYDVYIKTLIREVETKLKDFSR